MVRKPCCENVGGLKKGPWASEEDVILVNFVKQYGHDNWRALPKRAGLMRCGKSCRLRWMNYLRPGIKRGNFTAEEEERIVTLHQELGNRWSVIASKLPGRTDNEIKNIWHTNLKKRINKLSQPETKIHINKTKIYDLCQNVDDAGFSNTVNDSTSSKMQEMDGSFWSEDFSTGSSDYTSQFSIDTTFSSDLNFISGIDFWSDMLSNEQELVEWPEFW